MDEIVHSVKQCDRTAPFWSSLFHEITTATKSLNPQDVWETHSVIDSSRPQAAIKNNYFPLNLALTIQTKTTY